MRESLFQTFGGMSDHNEKVLRLQQIQYRLYRVHAIQLGQGSLLQILTVAPFSIVQNKKLQENQEAVAKAEV
jgi:hypothetical protein